jgi:drug/metabolite transporter (DMT)-like permease
MKFKKEQIGEIFIWGEVVTWAFFPILTSILIQILPPIFSLGLSTFLAGIILLCYTIYKKNLPELINKFTIKDTLIATLILGVVYYSLYTLALQSTTPNNIAILGLTQLLFTILYFGILTKKEPQTSKSLIGTGLIVIGTLIIVVKQGFQINPGDLLIIFANAICPFANNAVKKARQHISASSILTIRSLVAGTFLLVLSFIIEKPANLNFNNTAIIILLINGFIMLGISKIFWVEGIHRIDISKGLTFGATGPAFTMLFSFLILSQAPTFKQISGLIPMVIGIYLITSINLVKKNQETIEESTP